VSRILGSNGLPAGQPPAVIQPGQQAVQILIGPCPAGVMLVVGGAALPLAPDQARAIGNQLIGWAHLHDTASQTGVETPMLPSMGQRILQPSAPSADGTIPLPGPADDGPAEEGTYDDLLREAIAHTGG